MSSYHLPAFTAHLTEEPFVNDVLAPHLYNRGYYSVYARLVGNARQCDDICDWNAVRRDITNGNYMPNQHGI